MKVKELAKELNISSKKLLAKASELKIKVKSPGDSLTSQEAKKVKSSFASNKKKKVPVKKKVSAKKVTTKAVKKKTVKVKKKKAPITRRRKVIKPVVAKEKPSAIPAVERKRAVEEKVPQKTTPVVEEVKKEEKVVPEVGKKIEKEKVAVPPAKVVKIDETTTVSELASKMEVKVSELIKKLMSQGILATINQRLDIDTATIAAGEFGFGIEVVPLYGEELLEEKKEDESLLKPRPPIVTIMGHVDHGKTSLLDAIRESKIISKESGGITQHIGAYHVSVDKGDIVFLDTPGHEAFTAMRARGAQVTDIIVLVVAADEGARPQTIEAIDHARAAGVPILVAVNKIDLPNANVEKVKQELSQYNLVSEDWGGKTIFVEVSAKEKIGLDNLLEMILLEAEMLELKANPDKKARGTVIEARLDKQRGPVATVLVQSGRLEVSDPFVSGFSAGKVRAMIDDRGRKVRSISPSMPAEVLGFSSLPQAGDRFYALESDRAAREISEIRQRTRREEILSRRKRVTLEDLHEQIALGKLKELKIIVKADVQGSVEALCDSLQKLSTHEITLNVVHRGVGGITESDVMLGAASNAIIIGFNVRPAPSAEELAEKEGVDIHTYRVIYEAVEETKKAMEGLLEPEYKEVPLGRAEVKRTFRIPRVGMIAGCSVAKGKISRQSKVRLLRDNVIIYEGKISSLKRFKDDVREVDAGFECGVGLENFSDIKENDILEAFTLEKIARKL
ncbi:translation initiation factor IF-2 [bacterium]|nr:translation initiation factor IF-2 [bacterium]NIN93034.1 translation initiation factor IF-2 [bacterium]NIO18903.1 translation initiation factor IF-2 [bacterium]NIO73984.1 translation initiation factor IF-2 [bacterium]